MHRTILVADDERTIRETLSEVLRERGFKVVTAADGLEAIQQFSSRRIDMALLDIRMSGLDGLEVLAKTRQSSPQTQVIMITACGTVENAVEAIKLGASDYVTKPIIFEDIILKIERLLNLRRLADDNLFLMNELEDRYSFEGIIGTSRALQDVLGVVRQIANTRTRTIITGESGTGKEVIARAIHYNGITKNGRFVALNCAALPETLVESELFGYKRGAFTGAIRDKPGLFEMADGGTMFLDEISAMPISMQAKLLRAVEEKQVLPIGGTEPIDVDARIICATNHDLSQEVKAGRFREDVYYRLNVVEIHIPPLRERREDIPLLADYFVDKYCRELNKRYPGVSERAMEAMVAYHWPGNVRELQNVIERGVIFADGRPIDLVDLPFTTADVPSSGVNDLKSALRVYEKQYILRVLRSHDYDRNVAARAMKIG
ncbi:MAG: sigma-54 dependent transcriptional regulator, partial [Planctomycetia bacterium]|nr:sigma-54 dependent transcriptional regulator [Planctomycetia bacterium]